MPNVTMSISAKAFMEIAKGTWTLSSGGVRNAAGEIMELAKPCVVSNLSGGIPGQGTISMASSLVNNAQSAFIQKGVNLANKKLNTVVSELGNISNTLGCLGQIQTLSWVNTAFGLANCGISIYGFKKTLNKLGAVEEHIKDFHNEYRKDRSEDFISEYEKCFHDLKLDANNLSDITDSIPFNKSLFESYLPSLGEHINTGNLKIKDIQTKIDNNELNQNIGYQMIYTLSPVLTEVINQTVALYYFSYQKYTSNYKDYTEYLTVLEDNQPKLKNYLRYDESFAEVPRLIRKSIFNVLSTGVDNQKNKLEVTKELLPTTTEQEYKELDSRMNEAIINELENENPGHDIIGYVTNQIQTMDISDFKKDADDNVIIPIGIEY